MMKGQTTSKTRATAAAAMLVFALSGPALADKVGVAAAVNPDAFSSLSGSPKTQLNIGKSIFFNERINTTGSGLVQVLLVDGSTFTVGPGSDLVIDKFVYDPNKKTGEVVATFSKGVMRFVGGKISKNPDGVTVNTPAGVLAIRGGMFQTNLKVFSFLFGETMTLQGKNGQSYTVFQPGNSIDLSSGVPNIRTTTAGDIAAIMAALTPGGNGGVTPGQTPAPSENGVKAATLGNVSAEIINEATAQQIQDQIQKEIENLSNAPTDTPPPPETTDTTTPTEPTTTPTTTGDTPPPPPPQQLTTLLSGYAGGTFIQSRGDDSGDLRTGTLTNLSPTGTDLSPKGFVPLFDANQGFQGAEMTLFVNSGAPGEGGATLTFVSLPQSEGINPPTDAHPISIFWGVANEQTIVVYNNTLANPPRLDGGVTPSSAYAVLGGFNGAGAFLCDNCDFLKWGGWLYGADFQNGQDSLSVFAKGWWVAGDIVKDSVGALPITGGADYSGLALGTVTTDLFDRSSPYVAQGNMDMHWDFGTRSGQFNVANFDVQNIGGQGLKFGGPLAMPGVPTGQLNQFSGPLTGTLPNIECVNPNLTGAVTGSFVKGPGQVAGNIPAAVIGNFAISNGAQQRNFYDASGIFAGSPR